MTEYHYRAARETIGALECIVVSPSEARQLDKVAVFCHGFGAPGEDLVGIAEEFLEALSEPLSVGLIFPAAPIDLEADGMPGCRAWWKLSVARLLQALEAGRYEQVREEVPQGIDEARAALTETIDLVLERFQLPPSKLMLGGFSQGAMLSVDVACRGLTTPPGAIAIFSGALICERIWRPASSRLADCLVMQSHGRADMVLPFQLGLWLRDMLAESGCKLDFVEFSGPHTIPRQAVLRSARMLEEL